LRKVDKGGPSVGGVGKGVTTLHCKKSLLRDFTQDLGTGGLLWRR